MTDELDFDQLVELFDKALTSNDPNVQKALKKFLFIVTLSKDTEEKGPFSRLMDQLEEVDRRLAILEAERHYQTYPNYPQYPTTGGKITWGGNSTTTTTVKINSPDVDLGDGTSGANYTTYTYAIPQGYGSYTMNSNVDSAINDLDDIINSMS